MRVRGGSDYGGDWIYWRNVGGMHVGSAERGRGREGWVVALLGESRPVWIWR